MKRLLYILSVLLPAGGAFAQEQPAEITQAVSPGNTHQHLLIAVLIITSLLVLLASFAILKAYKVIVNELSNPVPFAAPVSVPLLTYEEYEAIKKSRPSIWIKILGLKPIEEEKDLMMEHEFDGITELDNPIPAWFMWLFYGSIGWAFVYLLYFHVFNWGPLQDEEYAIEMKQAKIEQTAFLSKSANNIDENSVKENKDPKIIAAGQAVYTANCVACHGDKGQGTVGPNLTDQFWLHGGKVNSVFKTIKYGVPEKGMISWEKILTAKQISEVSNYILSIKGSNPPSGKAPQGDKEG
ncbi:cbb3-type cytochrome c oxidase N-terminal domain-containing protein [Daejeonella oryzae]|uniref:cbb3-type cytochrome c oxidase N-terminal domain-containing protein n=1 Tax=Daejeonella oryzae TaxID=1122943 RepID=UPI0004135E78|nr:cbb3-type cytochrome c oxidase N-terminal domain-containing protein [Daejeonella oryzae]